MEMTREMWFGAGAGAIAFIGAVAWMVPPTTPVAPMAASARPRASSVAKPASDAPQFAGADVASQIPAPIAPAIATPTPVTQENAMPTRLADATPPRPRWRDVATADRDEDDAVPEETFDTGYRWAEANDIVDRRDCRRWRGSPAWDGCRVYLREADVRDPADPEDRDVASEPQ
jgi:hypothetical protein